MRRIKKEKLKQQKADEDLGYIEGLLSSPDFLQKCRNLTERERGIVELIWCGHRMREIAEVLGLSQRTVEFHRYNIMKKYRVDNTVQMLRVALAKRVIHLSEAEKEA